VGERWLFNANSAISQLYHGKNTLQCSLKQQCVDRYVAALGHIILIPNKPVVALSP